MEKESPRHRVSCHLPSVFFFLLICLCLAVSCLFIGVPISALAEKWNGRQAGRQENSTRRSKKAKVALRIDSEHNEQLP